MFLDYHRSQQRAPRSLQGLGRPNPPIRRNPSLNDPLPRVVCLVTTVLVSVAGQQAQADVGPPVEIGMAAGTVAALSGQEYHGVWEVRVSRPGTLDDIRIAGEGWTLHSVDAPATPVDVPVGTLRIAFRATPMDADKPIGLTLTYDGRRVAQRYIIGPAYFSSIDAPIQVQQLKAPDGQVAGDCFCSPGGILDMIRGFGRIVYMRPDGKTVGADRVRVQIRDNDPVGHELLWEGFTDQNGYFDSGCQDGDVDGDGSGADLILYFETDNGWVDVTDNSVFELTYWAETEEIEDYPFECIDFGTITPVDVPMHNALHISNVATRTRRYLDQLGGFAPSKVQVEWPVEEWTHYQHGPEEIHLNPLHEWEEFVIIHEYGHHFMNHFGNPPSTNYCNGFCDDNPPEDCGHCLWCPETITDAFNEGFPNWMADVITRSFAETYEFSPGVPYEPILEVSFGTESPRMCNSELNGQEIDPFWGDPLMTEGFVGLLLRDMEDDAQDDHDGDGIFDMMCAGALPIFDTYVQDQATTILEFLTHFRNRYPEHTGDLWPTAFNVGGADYVAGFPLDMQPPGIVASMDSSTHPLGQGGDLPCITFEFEPAPDDVTGAGMYSYVITANPAGEMPNTIPNGVQATDGCRLQGTVPVWEIGTWYISIRARDYDGNWSDGYATFGPFEVLDCNNTGQLDVCDISCLFTGIPGTCNYGISPCLNLDACVETSEDCNGNFRPDECDIADGTSEDCNLDGVPDECQPMKHWSGSVSSNWAQAPNWMEVQIPQNNDHVCIQSEDTTQVTYQIQNTATLLASLASYIGLTVSSASNPWPSLEIAEPSFIHGEFILGGSSTSVTVHDLLELHGLFRWNGGILRGAGRTNVRAGLALGTFGTSLESQFLSILNGPATSQGGGINLTSNAIVVIEPDVTYQYNSNSGNVFTGGTGTLVNNAGTIQRATGSGVANISAPLTNIGSVHVKTGELVLGNTSSHIGQLLGDEGTIVTFSGVGAGPHHNLLAASTLDVHSLTFTFGEGHFRGSVNIGDTIHSSGGTYYFQPEADINSYGRHVIVSGTPTGSAGQLHFLAVPDPLFEFESVTAGQGGGNTNIHFDTGQPFNIESLIFLAGGINGDSPINVNGMFTWTSGNFWPGGDVTANGPIVMQNGSRSLNNRTLHNTQTATMLGGSISLSGANGRWNNLPDSTLLIQAEAASISGGIFTNASDVIRASGAGIVTISSSITNTGLIHNQTGTLSLNGSNLNPPSTHSGTVRSDAGSVLRLGGGTHNFQPSSNLTAETLELSLGSGTVAGEFDVSESIHCNGCNWTFGSNANILDYGDDVTISPGGVLRFEAPIDRGVDFDTVTIGPSTSGGNTFDANTGQPFNIKTLIMNNNSQLSGNSPINVTQQFTWQNGNMFSGGDVTLNGDTNVMFTTSARSASRHIHNHGTMTLLGAFGLSGSSSLTNHPGAVIDFQSNNSGISSRPIYNHGLFVKSGGDGQASVNFTTWTNTGTIDIQAGSIGMHTTQFIQEDGETILSGGDLRVVFGTFPVTINGGIIKGINTVFGNLVNQGGTTAPGLSTGQLTISGNYTQGANATLDIEIGGTSPGEFDVLAVTGTATLAGGLTVTDLGEGTLLSGHTVAIVTASTVAGTFDQLNIPPHLKLVYGPTSVTLEGVESSADLNGDGQVDLKDLALFQVCFSGSGLPPASECSMDVNADIDADEDVDLNDFILLHVYLGS